METSFDIDLNIIKKIGNGSFSNVYLCNRKDDCNSLLIVKKIDINELVKKYTNKGKNKKIEKKSESILEKEKEYYSSKLNELIKSEIEILSRIDHQHIVAFYGSFNKKSIYYLKMEYCDLGDVYEFLKNKVNNINKKISYNRNCFGGFSNGFMQEFIRQSSYGLKYLHDKNIIHRDIKLHNILMTQYDNKLIFKISDFGFSCFDLCSLKRENVDKVDKEDILSQKYFKLSGTPYYMAPEIICNLKKMENITYFNGKCKKISDLYFYDKRVDIWSLGICLYELIFNLLPFININNVNDLEKFYRMSSIGEIMNKKITKKSILVFAE